MLHSSFEKTKSLFFKNDLQYAAVPRKVVLQKCKSVGVTKSKGIMDNAGQRLLD